MHTIVVEPRRNCQIAFSFCLRHFYGPYSVVLSVECVRFGYSATNYNFYSGLQNISSFFLEFQFIRTIAAHSRGCTWWLSAVWARRQNNRQKIIYHFCLRTHRDRPQPFPLNLHSSVSFCLPGVLIGNFNKFLYLFNFFRRFFCTEWHHSESIFCGIILKSDFVRVLNCLIRL